MEKQVVENNHRHFNLWNITTDVEYDDREDIVSIPVSILRQALNDGATSFVSDDEFFLTDEMGEQYLVAKSLLFNAGTFCDIDDMIGFVSHLKRNIYDIKGLIENAKNDKAVIEYV